MRYFFLVFLFLFSLSSQALTLRENAPARYVVQPGDTLWEIANHYLAHPWEWKTLWHANPQIKNPRHLYPGAVLELHYYQQNPYLKVLSNGTVKLSPYMRPVPIEDPIPAIPLSDIRAFFNGSVVLDWNSLKRAPYVVSMTLEHILGGQGDEVYVKNLCPTIPPKGTRYSYTIYRASGVYTDPYDKSLLGYKATLIGYAELLRGGDPARIVLTDITQSVQNNDRVLPRTYPEYDLFFEPKTPAKHIDAVIIDMPGDFTQGAMGSVAVINKGKDCGLQAGDVLAIYSRQRMVPNPKHCPPNCTLLPSERIGEMMIFRTFTRTSFGLIVRSTDAIKARDKVTNP